MDDRVGGVERGVDHLVPVEQVPGEHQVRGCARGGRVAVHADDLMTAGDELAHEDATEEAGGPRDDDGHAHLFPGSDSPASDWNIPAQ
jgi:hypothetical protein